MARPKVLIVRDGAIGDVIQITPALRAWATARYRVVVATHRSFGDDVLKANPHVYEILNVPDGLTMPQRESFLKRYVERHGIPAHRWIDLAGSCESKFLWHSFRPEYHWPLESRRAANANVNYVRHICCDLCGGDSTRMELFTTKDEDAFIASQRARFGQQARIVYLQLHGSSLNKAWPYWPILVSWLHRDPRVIVITGGSPRGATLEKGIAEYDGVDGRRLLPLCSNGGESWTLRKSILMTKLADIVIGPETGLINAAMAWQTPTIVMSSHTYPHNLVDPSWPNVWHVEPDRDRAPCAPCYRIVGDEDGCDTCDWGPSWLHSAYRCMAAIYPEAVYAKYQEVKNELASRELAAHVDHRQRLAVPLARPCVPALRVHGPDARA